MHEDTFDDLLQTVHACPVSVLVSFSEPLMKEPNHSVEVADLLERDCSAGIALLTTFADSRKHVFFQQVNFST